MRVASGGCETSKLAVSVDDLFHRGRTERADQLLLQVSHADVEAERLHVRPGRGRAEAGTLERALKEAFLGGVAQTGQLDVEASRPEALDEAPDRLRTSIGTIDTPSAARFLPRRSAKASSACWSLTPSTRTTAR